MDKKGGSNYSSKPHRLFQGVTETGGNLTNVFMQTLLLACGSANIDASSRSIIRGAMAGNKKDSPLCGEATEQWRPLGSTEAQVS